MIDQHLHSIEHVGSICDGLGSEPLVEHESVALCVVVEFLHRSVAALRNNFFTVHRNQVCQGRVLIGHPKR